MDFSGFVNVGYCGLVILLTGSHLSGYHCLCLLAVPSWGKLLRFDTFKKQQHKRRHSRRRSLIIFCKTSKGTLGSTYFFYVTHQYPVAAKPEDVPESIEWFKIDRAFLRSYDSAPHPLPPPPIPWLREQVVFLSQSFGVLPLEFTDGGGVGEEPNHHIIRPREDHREKIFPSINHSILSRRYSIVF